MHRMLRALPVVVVAVVTSAGCAQLAGIDHTSGNDRNTDTVAIQRMSIGSTVVYTDLDLTGLEASYLVEDPASATGFDKVTADTGKGPQQGVWHADLPEPAPVVFTLPDVPTPIPRLFAFPDRALRILFGVLEHPGRSPAPEGAMLTVTAPLDVATLATDSFRVFTVGSWTTRTFATAELPAPGTGVATIGPVTYVFSTASSLSGRPELDRLTAQDAFLILRYSGAALTGVAEAPPFDQTGNDTVTTPTMTAVSADQVLEVKVTPAALSTRYASVRPAVANLAMNWSIVAAPGSSIANNSGPVLQSGALAPLTDLGVMVKYGNPFAMRGWNTMFTLATSESRVYMAPSPTGTTGAPIPVTLFAGMNQFLDLSPAVAPLPELTLEAGLPVTISIGGIPLLTDGQMIAKPTKFVEVTFQADKPTATLFNLQVFDLLPNMAATALDYHLVLAAASSEPKFELSPDTFQVGHSYTLRALCTSGGYPGVAAGDFQTRTLPLSQSFLDSAVFAVTP
jgi:hypothetical protein